MGCILAFVWHPAQIAQLTSAGGKGDAVAGVGEKMGVVNGGSSGGGAGHASAATSVSSFAGPVTSS